MPKAIAFLFCPLLCLSLLLATVHEASAQGAAERYQYWFRQNAIEIRQAEDLQPLLQLAGARQHALLGEASHGSHEFYYWRDLISRQLIEQHGFDFVAVEGDWETIYRLNHYVKHRSPADRDIRELMLEDVRRWPQWMWANEEFADFLEWLRDYNAGRDEHERIGVFGLDMQDAPDSMAAVVRWFETHDAANLERVRLAYQELLEFPEGLPDYARNLAAGGERLDGNMQLVVDILRERRGNQTAGDTDKALWTAKQNAFAVQRAEAQYHAMVRGTQADSWNLRAGHMHEAFLRIAERYGENSRGIVWAHNTHVGDARHTNMQQRGEFNIGQLLRESEGEDRVFILGFSTYQGQVLASTDWGAARLLMDIVPGRSGSLEALLHNSGLRHSLLIFDAETRGTDFRLPLAHRAIGVIYRPPGEAYVTSLVPWRYDALFYIDETRALSPLHP